MCELLAYTSQSSKNMNNILEAFYQRSKYHPHGWGQVVLDSENPVIQKEPISAFRSVKLHKILQEPIDTKSMIAHIRYATTGDMKYENTHPFEKADLSGRRWVLIHNGTVLRDDLIEPFEKVQQGDTDSERILLYIVDRINQELKRKKRDLSSEERFEIIDSIVHELSQDNNKLNLIIFDGEQFYFHTNGFEQMYQCPYGDGTLFCTRNLLVKGESLNWKSVPRMRTLCYKDGVLENYGQVHGNEYIPDPEVEKELISRYAHLG